MEAPTPIKENNIKFDTTETFDLDDTYILKISINKDIIFYEVQEKDKFPKQDYNIFLDLEELNKINRCFYQFESFKDFCESFKNLISKKIYQ